MKNKIHQITTILLALLILCACSRSYSIQYYSFPSGTKPHENDWTYLCQVRDWAPLWEKATDRGNRKIEIIINDNNKNNVLREELKLESAPIGSKIYWEDLERLTLEIYERGNQYAEDEYNKQRVNEGPKHLITLIYDWDGEKYIKSVTEQAR